MSKNQKQTLTAFGDALLKAVHSKEEPSPLAKAVSAKDTSRPVAENKPARSSKDRSHLYRLPDKQKARFREDLVVALGLAEGDISRLPKIFLSDQILPMKLGIHLDLFALFGIEDEEQGKNIRSVLHRNLARQLSYLRAVRDGTHRHDLDGNPVEEITDEHKKDASSQIKRIHQIIKKAKQEKK